MKIKIVDQDKAIKLLWMPMDDERAKPYIEKNGFQVTALTFKEEWSPQVAALLDLKEDIIGHSYGQIPDHLIEFINNKFKQKIEELKSHLITTNMQGIPDPNV